MTPSFGGYSIPSFYSIGFSLLQSNSHLVGPIRMIHPDPHMRSSIWYFRIDYGLLIDRRNNHGTIGRFEIARKGRLLVALYLPQWAQRDGRRSVRLGIATNGNA